MKRLLTTLSQKWPEYLLEILVLIIGIYGAFAVDNWNETKKDEQKIRIALDAVYTDLVQDSLIIHKELSYVSQTLAHSSELLHKVYKSSSNLDTIIHVMKEEFYFRWYQYFESNKNSFDYIKSSGTYDLLPTQIRMSLSEYYTFSDQSVKMVAEANDQYRHHFDDFLKTYNIIGRFHDDNYSNSYLYQTTWENVDPAHFLPRVATCVAGHKLLFGTAQYRLEASQVAIRKAIAEINDFLK